MKVEAVGKPVRYRLRSGNEIVLKPGIPVVLPDGVAQQLLSQAGRHVRITASACPSDDEAPVVLEVACPTARPIWWQGADGRLRGPATLEFLAKVDEGESARYWVVALYRGRPRWIRSDLLRSGARA